MLRDLNIFRRNSGKGSKGEEENIPVDSTDLASVQLDPDISRVPFHAIQEAVQNPNTGIDQEAILRRKVERTPSKNHGRSNVYDRYPPFRTPEKLAAARSRFGWVPKGENGDDSGHQVQMGRGGGYGITTPRAYRTAGKASSVHSDTSSTQSTPTKSVSKPAYPGSARPPLSAGPRCMNFSAGSKGFPVPCAPPVIYNAIEVPHFELKEDPAFWMEHNVQVVIRVRPLNSTEKNLQGYNRCVRQDTAQSIVWIGQPEARFTFDHVACETVSQEVLFRVAGLPMIENCMSGYNSCVFAYGQTGSGKTYTMLGEIDDLEIRPSSDRGMTPRIFEFLFARIKAEEESRRDEKLKYNCKCSFLEIYNEQITDLLDPLSTNLLLREDLRKGVYVENLTEFEVESVSDILKLLIQGAANRKVAATNMNRESSRSHSVFTCVIESRWEKDSTTNLRFARLNLVDLAGSERQKASGAEGERLKEAANINKSLSTLGHVIMILADVAHGRQRHVPYRDSRLTFLLQDSLGGNSKTMIIANVSPSICCANETLSTLKFAQRARLIQNNAVVNEDASGDILSLQHQIRLLKEELAVYKRQTVSRSLSFGTITFDDSEGNGCVTPMEKMHPQKQASVDGLCDCESMPSVRVSTKQLRSLEATLTGALRREKMADTTIKQLEAEIEQLNRLVRQREEDTRSSKMMLKFREDKVHRMESLVGGLLPIDSYLVQENNALSEEIKLLQTKVDRNPEVTRFALENIRLLDQLRRFQEFYEEGERGLLLNEVSELRNQLLQILDGKCELDPCPKHSSGTQEAAHCEFSDSASDNHSLSMELEKTFHELDVCKNDLKCCLEINSKLTREINDLQTELSQLKSSIHDEKNNSDSDSVEMCLGSPEAIFQIKPKKEESILEDQMKHAEEVLNLQLELDILKEILKEEKSSRFEVEERVIHANNELKMANDRVVQICRYHDDTNNELENARSIIDALESQHIMAINDLDKLREENYQYVDRLNKQEQEISVLRKKVLLNIEGEEKSSLTLAEQCNRPSRKSESESSPLQTKLKRMQCSLEKARILNIKYQTDQASQTIHEREMDEICRQVEAETAEVIVCMQEELISLQQQVDDSIRDKLLAEQSLVALQNEMKKLNERLIDVTNDNQKLCEFVKEKDEDLRSMIEDRERLAFEIAEVLGDGNAALEEAADQACSISCILLNRSWAGEQFERMIRSIYEKDELIYDLQNRLEDAQNVMCDMEWKLRSLRGATLAITETQQQETVDREREFLCLSSQLSERTSCVSELEDKIKLGEDRIRKAELCAKVAFMTVSSLSEKVNNHVLELEHVQFLLNQTKEMLSQKDLLLQSLMVSHADAEQQIQDLKYQLEQSQMEADVVRPVLGFIQEPEQRQDFELQMKNEEEFVLSNIAKDLRKARIKLNEFKTRANPAHSNEYVEQAKDAAQVYCPGNFTVENDSNDAEDRGELRSIDFGLEQHIIKSVPDSEMRPLLKDSNVSLSGCLMESIHDREVTIVLLRKEIESALDSLEGVQAQMVKLLYEKEESKKTEMQNRERVEHLVAELLELKSQIDYKEQECEGRLLVLEKKLQIVETNAIAANDSWNKFKEVFESEVCDAKAVATQKTIEASHLLSRIEEAQETMKDADDMVNALLEANVTAKRDIERLQQIEATLKYEKSCLMDEVQVLQSSLDTKNHEYQCMETAFEKSLMESRSFVLVLEDTLRHLQASVAENFKCITCNIDWMKLQLHHYVELAQKWLEDICLEIIGKDCAVSVLHLCHMGILLERLTGLNAENCFLSRGLCESNSVIADLREHNVRAKKELEICSILKGKLLVDINNSFNRITNKEAETMEFRARLNTFEKKILNLQYQEESMLARSNSMGGELAMLTKELDLNNRSALAAVSLNEKVLRENEDIHRQLEEKSRLLNDVNATHDKLWNSVCEDLDLLVNNCHPSSQITSCNSIASAMKSVKEAELNNVICSQTESLAIKIFAKDFELLVLESELEQRTFECQRMTSQIDHLENHIFFSERVIEKAMEEMIIHKIDGELKGSEIKSLLLENEVLNVSLTQLKEENSRKSYDLEKAKAELTSSTSKVIVTEQENHSLKDTVSSLLACMTSLQADIDMKNEKLEYLECSYSDLLKELDLKSQAIIIQTERTNALKSEYNSLENEVVSLKRKEDDAFSLLNINLKHCFDSVQSMAILIEKMFHIPYARFVLMTETIYHKVCEQKELATEFVDKMHFLELAASELLSKNQSLNYELIRKDEASKGLLYDLSLLQESASIAMDQKDELDELTARVECLEDELERKSCELKEALEDKSLLEADLLKTNEKLSDLELVLADKNNSSNLVLVENQKLKEDMEDILEANVMVEEELHEKIIVSKRLEEELVEMGKLLGQRNNFIEDLQSEMTKLADEREDLALKVLVLKEQLEMAHALAEENEAIATEARQLAEGRKAYAEEKEEEVRLLERSVEELEFTVNTMESKVEIVKEEAERQRLQREEMEVELQVLRHQLLTVPSSAHIHNMLEDRDTEFSRQLKAKATELQEAQRSIKDLHEQVADKDMEISQCKAHISELNLHAEAQAREYKQKFKQLEAMAQEVRADTTSSNATSVTSTKSEKTAAKSRGSGSPFKCIGLGLGQQINSEKDEELSAARRQIEELEGLVTCKQKELFMLNARLAAAESMTHDVIRDLLGVKLDMANYASLLDNPQIQRMKEPEQCDYQEPQHKDKEVLNLKRQLNQFIQERQSWLDEINERQAELASLRNTLEKLRQRERMLTTENEMLKVDNSKHKKMIVELEHEIDKLSKQQNLQQRIHHHAKTKEENSLLRIQNDELDARLQQSEALLLRVKEELARYRAAGGKKPSVDFDEEEQLKRRLEDSEQERLHLGQKLLGLCTSILEVAGFTQQVSSPSLLTAQEALDQLKNRINSLEIQIEDLKLKCKIYCEKIRLGELKQECLPPDLRVSPMNMFQSPEPQNKCTLENED
ncbi:kinesin-like protein KIN-12F [Dioscorea cayenensis subsp. rotundata]|uniref:Kinesin-like protein KIN-12F n=1 Tax=Dioscorea cayennensis subsp. rotundata TaxID=55577 RepID=A0AB40CJ08_DIOCR|nr:kinesin-like protein KIN-12F [Dioscorea cayenensis subsp. rotundata]